MMTTSDWETILASIDRLKREVEALRDRALTPPQKASPLVMSPMRYAKLMQTHAYVGARLRVPTVLHWPLTAARR